jgi:inosose dehydratase
VPAGITLCVENHWDQPLAYPGEVLEAIAGTELRACLDTGHALLAGVAPDRFAAELEKRLRHVHLKEGRLPSVFERLLGRKLRKRLLSKPAPVAPGDGALDVVPLRAALESMELDVTVTLEHEGPEPAQALSALSRLWHAAALDPP